MLQSFRVLPPSRFDGSYHGHFDGFLGAPTSGPDKCVPVSSGIVKGMVEDLIILKQAISPTPTQSMQLNLTTATTEPSQQTEGTQNVNTSKLQAATATHPYPQLNLASAPRASKAQNRACERTHISYLVQSSAHSKPSQASLTPNTQAFATSLQAPIVSHSSLS